MKPSWRKPFGALAILLFIAVYGAAIAHFAENIMALPQLVQLLLYVVLGIIWVFPLRPLLTWMETGRFG